MSSGRRIASPVDEPEDHAQNDADDERGHDVNVKAEVLALDHDVAGQAPKTEPRYQRPQHAEHHQHDAQNDEQASGRHYRFLARGFSFSRTTSSARLSSRSPRNTGCRISPPDVHSVNLTSATSRRFTQVVTASSFTRAANGDDGACSFESLSWSCSSVTCEKPVPTWPI